MVLYGVFHLFADKGSSPKSLIQLYKFKDKAERFAKEANEKARLDVYNTSYYIVKNLLVQE